MILTFAALRMESVDAGSHSFTCYHYAYPRMERAIDPPQCITALWLVFISLPQGAGGSVGLVAGDIPRPSRRRSPIAVPITDR